MSSRVSVYIHIPFCRTRCDYCDFFSTACGKNGVPDSYVAAVCNEIKARLAYSGSSCVRTVYIGGGTPSLLSASQLKKISGALSSVSAPKSGHLEEFTLEVNPDDVTRDFLLAAADAGVDRLSCGVQAFEDDVLSGVKRRCGGAGVLEALELISLAWKGRFSADIISALPGQTEENFCRGIRSLVEYPVDHISMYSLTIEPETPLGKKLDSGLISYDFDAADRMWLMGRDILENSGFRQYEVSNFSRPGKQCIHNMVYWRLEDYIGCGAGATGSFYGSSGRRFTNTKNIEEYIRFWLSDSPVPESAPGEKEMLSSEVQAFEFFMMGLRTLRGVCLSDYKERFGSDIPENIISEMNLWKNRSLADFYYSENGLCFALNSQGILFLNDFLRKIL